MSLSVTTKPFSKAFVISLMAATAISMLPAQASGRDPAPIRFGHATQTTAAQPARVQYASATPTRRSSVRSDVFAYPDEPLPAGYGRAETIQTSYQVSDLTNAQYQIPYVDPVEYASYVKIGNPYTVNGITYYPEEDPFYNETGMASWYGPGFHGNLTANGETYDMHAFTAAHPTLPLPSFVEVTNHATGESVVVRVNDRGPFARDRVIDMSYAAAERISLVGPGSAEVQVRYLGPAPRDPTDPPVRSAPTPVQPDVIQASYEPPAPSTLLEAARSNVPSHYVQLSSFQDRGNANAFRDQLRSSGSDANVVFATVNGARYYRVVLGPFNSETAARGQQQAMLRQGYEGFVIENP
ncbi:septal ring lytic transglycosylase RlpA family protein [Ponticaulis sp.]|uniref:septal ring lytic transglycosylase RlpA family protein n=1 Tax=Ponticaulis sp. TaxID=2020902 RepID=UPI000B69C673|nr:septal ring lytic transglycosylase RlpA family protein [Ponticaulis sp.]OUY00432.1 MAG: hypothetical protein CBB65_03040 [Hyphomonadaceae bacterium TMED5]